MWMVFAATIVFVPSRRPRAHRAVVRVVHAVHRRAQRVDHLERLPVLSSSLQLELGIVVVELLELVARERLDARAERRKVLGLGRREEVVRAVLHQRGHQEGQRDGAEDGGASAATSVTMR